MSKASFVRRWTDDCKCGGRYLHSDDEGFYDVQRPDAFSAGAAGAISHRRERPVLFLVDRANSIPYRTTGRW